MNRININSIQALRIIRVLYLLAVIAVTAQSILIGTKQYHEGGRIYTHYNNYVIFRQSAEHLSESKDLYAAYPEEHWDLYKYSPAFALFFSVFLKMPDAVGLGIWNLLNALVFFLGIRALPWFSNKQKNLMLLACLVELVTSMQNNQSNGLIAGMILLGFAFMERYRMGWASLLITATGFIKVYSIAALGLVIFYRRKFAFLYNSGLWFLLLLLVPMVVADGGYLAFLYESWIKTMSADHAASQGLSVMGWLQSWVGWEPSKTLVLLIGLLLFAIPLVRFRMYRDVRFRLLTLASLLICLVIFNHKAESPTFIIAVAGVALWYFSAGKSILNMVLLALVLVFTSLSPTDLFPPAVRRDFFIPYAIKVVPCIVVWLKIIYDQIAMRREEAANQPAPAAG